MISTRDFVTRLAESGLLASQPPEMMDALQGMPSAQEAAKELIKRNLLTEFQAQVIANGERIPLIIGDYIVQSSLGRGGMGYVLKARHRRMKRDVAIKFLLKELTAADDAKRRFEREVEAAAQLNHQNIVTAYDAGEHTDGSCYLVMQYVDGQDLSHFVKANGPVSILQAVNIISQAAEGLAFAHDQGIVHRDIKPGNLLLDKQGIVRILDMGLARMRPSPGDSIAGGAHADLTNTGSVMGTIDYMAPEQALDAKSADHRADIYSLGCTLWFLLSGNPPYREDTIMRRLLAHREQHIPSVRSVQPQAPSELDEILQRMMAKSKDDRFPSMRHLLVALQGLELDDTESEQIATLDMPDDGSGGFIKLPENESFGRPASRTAPLQLTDSQMRHAQPISSVKSAPPSHPDAATIVAPDPSGASDATVTFQADQSEITPGSIKPPEQSPAPSSRASRSKLAMVAVGSLLLAVIAAFAFRGGKPTESTSDPTTAVNVVKPTPDVPAATDKSGDAVDFAAERKAAEWVLAKGGSLEVRNEKGEPLPMVDGKLPTEPFVLGMLALHGNGNSFTDADLANLARCRRIASFDVRGRKQITAAGMKSLAAVKSLWNVDLRETGCGDEFFPLMANWPNLSVLAIGDDGNPVTDAGLRNLPKSLGLASLEISSGKMTDEGMALIAERLPILDTITIWRLGESVSLRPLQRLSALKRIHCSFAQLTDDGIDVLASHPNFQSLAISGITSLNTLVSRLTKLETRLVDMQLVCRIDMADVGVWQRFGRFTRLSQLLVLVESDSGSLTDDDLASLANVPKLQELTLQLPAGSRAYTPAGIARFRQLRPDVHLVIGDQDFAAAKPRDPGHPSDTPKPATVSVETALKFDGKQSHVRTPLVHGADTPLTIEFTLPPGPRQNAVISDSEAKGMGIDILSNSIAFVVFRRANGKEDYVRITSPNPLAADRTYRVATVYDSGKLRLYVDGKLEASGELRGDYLPSNLPIYLGASPEDEGIDYPFTGTLDEVRFSKVARYEADYTPAARLTSDADTLALYHFDEGVGDVLTDSSGNNRHGKIIGAQWLKPDGSLVPAASIPGKTLPVWVDWLSQQIEQGGLKGGGLLHNVGFVPDGNSITTDQGIIGVGLLPETTRNGAMRVTYLLRGSKGIQFTARERKTGGERDFVYFAEDKGDFIQIARVEGGKFHTLADQVLPTSISATAPRTLEFRLEGESFTLILNDSVKLTAKDAMRAEGGYALSATKGVLIQKVEVQNLDAVPADTPETRAQQERQAAEWVLSVGGKGYVALETTERVSFGPDKPLPVGPFSVVSLHLEGSKVRDNDLRHLSPCRRLESLALFNTSVDGSGLQHLTAAQSLIHLMASGSPLTDQGMASVAKFPKLKRLFLLGNEVLTDAGFQHLSDLSELEVLDANSVAKVTDKGLVSLNLQRLKSLKPPPTITDAGVRSVVSKNPGLEEISLEHSAGVVAGRTLSPLRDAKRLKALSISGDQLTPEGLAVLQQLPDVETVFLTLPCTDEIVSRLVELPKLKDVTIYFWIAGDTPPDAGYAALAQHPGLEKLTLFGSSASPTDATILAFSKLPKLKTLDINFHEQYEKHRYTKEVAAKFREQRPDVTLKLDGVTYPATQPNGGGINMPPNAMAPFDTKQARAHQEAWAKQLGTMVDTKNSVGQTMILIPPGEFLMGSTDEEVEAALKVADKIRADQATKDFIGKGERPQHKVVISKPFLMGSTEVTVGQFKKFSATGYLTEAERSSKNTNEKTYLIAESDDLPVNYVSWNDAVAYCKWLSKQENKTYRLPSEAEWEYACRAGTTTRYSFGDSPNELPKYGWHDRNSGNTSHPVGTLLANPFGLFDMHGNLFEWCGDYWDEQVYATSAPSDPSGPSAGSSRVHRGGSRGYSAPYCGSAFRLNNAPAHRSSTNGFRCVAEIRSAPLPAVAPFDAQQAHAHQEAWAKHLGTTVATTNSVGAKMTLIPPGEFLMGSTPEEIAAGLKIVDEANLPPTAFERSRIPEEQPQHKVRITRPFCIGATEVTVGQFRRFVDATKYLTQGEQFGAGNSNTWTVPKNSKPENVQITWRTPSYSTTDEHPVTQVTWGDAIAYCNWLSEEELLDPCYESNGKLDWKLVPGANGYRLPTEAEWEYACRAGTTTQFSFGDQASHIGEHGWTGEANAGHPQPVARKLPNPFGLFDMHGNAREWCHDWYSSEVYAETSRVDPIGSEFGTDRVMRGGRWSTHSVSARSAFRYDINPFLRNTQGGFRVVRPPYSRPNGMAILVSPDHEWSEPQNLGAAVNSGQSDTNPFITADGLTLLFSSNRAQGQSGFDLWESRRASVEESFQTSTNLPRVVNSFATDDSPSLSADGLQMVFSSDRPGSEGDLDLYLCRRADPQAKWGPPAPLNPPINTDQREECGTFSPDGLTLYFASNRPNGLGATDIWSARRPSLNDPFGPPENLGSLVNSADHETHFRPTADGRGAVLCRRASDGRHSLWIVLRKGPAAPFATSRMLDPVAGKDGSVGSPSISADGRTLYFQAKRDGGQGDFDLWFIRRVLKSKGGSTSQSAR